MVFPALAACAPSRHVVPSSVTSTRAAVLAVSATSTTGTPPTTVDALATPAALADELASAEAALRDAALPEARLDDAGRRQVLAYRRLARHPEWVGQVVARVPATLGITVQR